MRTTAALLFSLCALTASASSVWSINPDRIPVGQTEEFLVITGSEMGDHVLFSGPAGEFDIEVSTYSASYVRVWIPEPVLYTPGKYSVVSHNETTRSAPATLTITGELPIPLMFSPHDPITKPAESAEGAHVEFDVRTVGGRDPNPTITCDAKSGQLFRIGPNHVRCEATNIYGEHATGGVYILVYDIGVPLVTVPYSVTVDAESKDGTRVEFEASATDVIDGPLPVTCDPPSGSLFPIGVTNVVCSATDSSGNVGFDAFYVEVIDPDAEPDPGRLIISVPANITVEAEGSDGAIVSFEVSASGTADPNPTIVCTPSSGSTFPIGTTNVVCDATDRFGATARGTFTVTVADTIAPLINTITATPDVLNPPNHMFVPVELTVDVADVVDPAPRCAILDFTSNQSIDDDVNITGDLSLELRAERDNGKERQYSIRVQCTDSNDNASIGFVIVRVPQGSDEKEQDVVPPTVTTPSKRRSVGRG